MHKLSILSNAALTALLSPIGSVAAGLAASVATVQSVLAHASPGVLVAAWSLAQRADGPLITLASNVHAHLLP